MWIVRRDSRITERFHLADIQWSVLRHPLMHAAHQSERRAVDLKGGPTH